MKLKDFFTFKKKEETLAPHLELGQRGELLAKIFLESEGYKIVASNFTIPVGRNMRGAMINGEIDIVAYDSETLCFVEVKTRRSDDFAAPSASVDGRKQRQITRAARAYRRMFGLLGREYRYDVVSIVLAKNERGEDKPRIELLRNFWTESKFRKRRWAREEFSY